jgi:hypothetical protein
MITTRELTPFIAIPATLFIAKMARVTKAIDIPKESVTLSTTFTCLPLKKTRVQQNPGRKNTNITPNAALRPGRC